jgi:hypothetical protein
MSAQLYYYVCDECGDIVDISAAPHDLERETWVCEKNCCDESGEPVTTSEFRDKDEAQTYSTRTMNKHFDEMRGAS